MKQSKDGPLQKPTRKSYHYLTSPVKHWRDEQTMDNPGKHSRVTERKPPVAWLPRWINPEGLDLKYLGKTVAQSQFNGFWYHISPSEQTVEVRGPYRRRKDAANAYEAYLAELVSFKQEVNKETGYEWDIKRK